MAKRENINLITESSGNIFADFGFPDADELQTKIKIAVALNAILEKLGDLTQEQIAKRLHTDQPKISALKRYQLNGISAERLLNFLTILDYDIDINIKPKARRQDHKPGYIRVNVAA